MKNDKNEDDTGENEFTEDESDPIANAAREQREIEHYRKLIRKHHNLEDDEFDTLLPTLEKLKTFHEESMHASKLDDDHLSVGEPQEAPSTDEDVISADDARRIREIEAKRGKKRPQAPAQVAALKKEVKTEKKSKLEKRLTEKFDEIKQAGAHLKPEDQVTPQDYQAMLDALKDDDDE